MKTLLYKEFRLCLVFQIPLFVAFVLMLLIPSYPYLVAGFFFCNAIFYSFMQASADNDILLSALLPVSKADVVRGKVAFAAVLQLAWLLILLPVVFLAHLLNPAGNAAGVDAGFTLMGGVLVLFGIFNRVFIPRWFVEPHKGGKHFLIAALAVFAWILVFEGFFIVCGAARNALPLFGWVETHLDCFPSDPAAWTAQGLFLAVGALVYAALTALTCRRAIRLFQQVDL